MNDNLNWYGAKQVTKFLEPMMKHGLALTSPLQI